MAFSPLLDSFFLLLTYSLITSLKELFTKKKIYWKCRYWWVCFFIGTDLEKCRIISLAHQWMWCYISPNLFWWTNSSSFEMTKGFSLTIPHIVYLQCCFLIHFFEMLTSSASVISEWTCAHFSSSKNHKHRHRTTKHLPGPNRFCSLRELRHYQCTWQVSRPHLPINNTHKKTIYWLSELHS